MDYAKSLSCTDPANLWFKLVRPDRFDLIGLTILDWPLWSDLYGQTK